MLGKDRRDGSFVGAYSEAYDVVISNVFQVYRRHIEIEVQQVPNLRPGLHVGMGNSKSVVNVAGNKAARDSGGWCGVDVPGLHPHCSM